MYTKDNISFVLVPGSFSTPYLYHKVTAQLQGRGYTVSEVPLTSASFNGAQIPPRGMHDDAAAIHAACTTLLDSGKNVILAMNSYGGIPGSESVRGLSKTERNGGGNDTGDTTGTTAVIGLVYIAAMLPFEGISSSRLFAELTASNNANEDEKPDLTIITKENDPYYLHHADPISSLDVIFSDIPDVETRRHYYDSMPVQSMVSFEEEVEYVGWKVVPSTYILCEEDMIIPPAGQRDMIEKADRWLKDEGKGSGNGINVVPLKSGHVPMVSRPDDIVRILLGAAGINAE